MSHAQPSVALVVVAFNHAAYLPATLRALDALEYAPRPQILLVENGDGSSAAVARAHGGIDVLEPGRNLGFAGGCNLAVAQTQAEIVVLINPDLEPRPAFLREIVAPLTDREVGVVGARLLYPDGRTLQHAGGLLHQPLLLSDHLGYGQPDGAQFSRSQDVEFVTGAAMALRRSDWQMLGGLDETFFPAYYEEVDLCLRARQRGLRVRYAPEAIALHIEAAGLGRRSAAYYQLYHRNRLRLLFKHQSDEWLLRIWLPAELTHLRTTADDSEIAGLLDAYLYWQMLFLRGADAADQVAANPPPPTPIAGELHWTVEQVRAKQRITPLPFRSRWPLAARLRGWLNRISVEEYLRPLIQQQNDYNAALAELAQALERQRRTTDAAIACQGALLAKMLGARPIAVGATDAAADAHIADR
jgi:GT2 family glycosyltransferase